MKSYGKLFEKVIDFENLWRAYRRARKGKRSRPDVAAFEYGLEGELCALREELATGTYRPGPYRHFRISEPKPRIISAAPFRDRVVHHALCHILEPIFEPRFIADSYACRVGKGTHRAILRCQDFQRRFAYRVQCDIVRFFPSVDHQILASTIGRRVRDQRVMALVRAILASGADIPEETSSPPHWFPGDDLFTPLRPRGLPIGNLTSQFWANVYLDPLDHFVKEIFRCRGYVRYCDDFILFADSRAQLREWRAQVEGRLAGLRLRLHAGGCHVVATRHGIPFLGFRIFPDRRLLLRQGIRRFRRRLKTFQEGFAAGNVTVARISQGIQSWVAHAAWGNTAGLRQAVLAPMVFTRG
jgi:retron-type reverse transcriptase